MRKLTRVCFCWTDISGYMASCWRELANRDGLDVHVIAYDSSDATSFSHNLMSGTCWTPLSEKARYDPNLLAEIVRRTAPDVVVLPGWLNLGYRRLSTLLDSPIQYLMTMDTPWLARPRQYFVKQLFKSYFNHLAGVVVTGERSWQYAVRLGFDRDRIYRGLYGVDYHMFSETSVHRRELGQWPRQFLFLGRYAKEKGVDVLAEGYRRYRALVPDPWPLVCCGKGELKALLANSPGVTDMGFCQPEEVRRQMAQSASLVLPSRFDPWPLSIVEGCAAGLPIVCSDACGSAVEVVRDGYNGVIVPPNDVDGLAYALLRIHSSYHQLPVYGKRSRQLASPYSNVEWADRWTHIIERTMNPTLIRRASQQGITVNVERKRAAA